MRMKVFLLTVLALVSLVRGDEHKILDDFDFDTLVNNDEQWKATFACFMDKAPCGDFQKVKDASIIRIQTNCEKCTPEQKEKYNHVIKLIQDKYPEELVQIMKRASKKE